MDNLIDVFVFVRGQCDQYQVLHHEPKWGVPPQRQDVEHKALLANFGRRVPGSNWLAFTKRPLW
jgi:hypothetical protein